MNTIRYARWAFALTVILAGLGLVAGSTAAAPAQLTPLQGTSCSWDKIGQSTVGHFHVASAMDTVNHTWYFYGGLDRSNDVVNFAGKADLSDADINIAPHATLNPTGRAERYGAVGAFRPDAGGDEHKAYFIAGGNADGEGEGDVQVYDIKNGIWGTVNVSGPFNDRLMSAGAYDPGHDAVILHGGTSQCRADGTDQDDTSPDYDPDACKGANFGTSYLTFDAMTGTPTWERGASGGPGQIYGHSMVYDSAGTRMLAFGGSTDGNRANNDVYELNLSDPDLDNASWSKLSTGGSQPSARFLHSAAYDAANNWMIVAGGVTRGAFSTGENTAKDTFALDLGQTPPAWVNISATVGDVVGAAMDFDKNHNVAVMHAGRSRFRSGNQTVSSDTDYLDCSVVVPTPTTPAPSPSATTVTPGPGTPTTPPPPKPTVMPGACDFINTRVPAAVINAALANPSGVQGYNELQNPGVPESPWNLRRTHLSLRNIAGPWHPLYNGLIYKAGCP